MLKLVSLVVDLISRFFKWRDDEKLRAEGRNLERTDSAKAVQKEAADAEKIREDVRARLDAHPDELRQSDGFERSD